MTARLCRCGCGRDVHHHHDPERTHCGRCGPQACPRYRPPRRSWWRRTDPARHPGHGQHTPPGSKPLVARPSATVPAPTTTIPAQLTEQLPKQQPARRYCGQLSPDQLGGRREPCILEPHPGSVIHEDENGTRWWQNSDPPAVDALAGEVARLRAGADPAPPAPGGPNLTAGQWIHAFLEMDATTRSKTASRIVDQGAAAVACWSQRHESQIRDLREQLAAALRLESEQRERVAAYQAALATMVDPVALVTAIRAQATARLNEHGFDDPRGTAIWDTAAWIEETWAPAHRQCTPEPAGAPS